ncbi:hypothetical protein KW797_01700 [Candidatus Parcubacteria bacterium]|nr:hypothetical protein [Candidatus Parcubacteria bacterium]
MFERFRRPISRVAEGDLKAKYKQALQHVNQLAANISYAFDTDEDVSVVRRVALVGQTTSRR